MPHTETTQDWNEQNWAQDWLERFRQECTNQGYILSDPEIEIPDQQKSISFRWYNTRYGFSKLLVVTHAYCTHEGEQEGQWISTRYSCTFGGTRTIEGDAHPKSVQRLLCFWFFGG